MNNIGQYFFIPRFGKIHRNTAGSSFDQNCQGYYGNPLSANERTKMPPEIMRTGKMIKVLHERQAGGSKSRHGFKTSIQETFIMSAQIQGDGAEGHSGQPGQGHNYHSLHHT